MERAPRAGDLRVALCTLLLAGAGLLVRTFQQLDGMDAGFDREHVVTFTTDPRLNGYTSPTGERAAAGFGGAGAHTSGRGRRLDCGAAIDAGQRH
jgi:hypothetical protein